MDSRTPAVALLVLLTVIALALSSGTGTDGGGTAAPGPLPTVQAAAQDGSGDAGPRPMDALAPVIMDDTPATATTGDAFGFLATVSDADGVSSVTVEHWRGASAAHTTDAMSRVSGDASAGNYTLTMTMPTDSIADMWYIIHASDTVGNDNATSSKRVSVTDNDAPTVQDLSPATATTGETFTFKVMTVDNIGINPLMVYVWYGFGSISEFQTMAPYAITGDGNGTYVFDVDVPSFQTGSLVYRYNVSDTSNNNIVSPRFTTPITDDDPPAFGVDLSSTAASTGDGFTFQVNISDNIDVALHKVVYWFGKGSESNASMTGVALIGTNGTYALTIAIPSDTLDPLHYRFYATDLAGNANMTQEVTRAVFDNDRPEYTADLSVKTNDTNFRLEVSVNDNIGVAAVYTVFWFDSEGPSNLTMDELLVYPIGNGSYKLDVYIPTCTTEPLHYVFATVDTSGNWNVTPEVVLDVSDNTPPTFGTDRTDATVVKGLSMNFSIDATDNIGVAAAFVEYWFGSGVHRNVTMNGPGGAGDTYTATVMVPRHPEGELHYVFSARDLASTWASTTERSRTPVNLPPVFDIVPTWTVTEHEQSILDLAGNVSDPNDPPSSLVLSCTDPRITVDGLQLTALYPTYMPDQRVELSLYDGEDTTYVNITVRVVNVDDAAVITSSPPLTATVSVTYTYQLAWTDEDVGDTFTFGLATYPTGMAVGPTGLVTWTPIMDQIGDHDVDITLSDGNITTHQTWTVTVAAPPVNQPPHFTNAPPLNVTAGQHYGWNATAEDPEGDALTFSLEDGPTGATMDSSTGDLSWDPPANRRTGYEDVNFTVQVSDLSNDVTLSFTVRVTYPADRPPEILGTPPAQRIKAAVTLNLSQYKSDPDDPKASLVWTTEGGNPDLFTVRIVGDSLTIEPKKGAEGISNFTLVLTDPWGAQDRYIVAVNVEGTGGGGDGGAGTSYLMWLVLLVVVIVVVVVLLLLLRGRKGKGKPSPSGGGEEGAATAGPEPE